VIARQSLPARPNAPINESAAPLSDPTPSPPAPLRERIPEESVIAERQLPSLKELLPTATWSSSSSRADAPISLNTRDPVYVTYFTKVKQLIESQWEYPEVALRYGLQGRLALQFTIGANGQLDGLRLIRSSGSQVLDEEALRAIKAAAPFPPIPPWIKPNPLLISASMEYHDNRLNYRFAR
jgi:TonB family protein